MTCTPRGASSMRATLVMATNAALDAQYAALSGRSTYEETLAMLTISPEPCPDSNHGGASVPLCECVIGMQRPPCLFSGSAHEAFRGPEAHAGPLPGGQGAHAQDRLARRS